MCPSLPSCLGSQRRRIGLLVAGILLTLHGMPAASAQRADPPSDLSPQLLRILDDPAHPSHAKDARLAVWVYFIERELTPVQREAALRRAEAELPADVARRRSKVIAAGRRLVDLGDLPLDSRHLVAAASSGASLRQESRWLGAASYDATPDQVRALAQLSCVRRVDVVWTSLEIEPAASHAPAPTAPTLQKRWSLDYGASLNALELINLPPVHELGYTGAGVKIAMLDSGFHMEHESLDHVPVLAAWDFAGDDAEVDYEAGDPSNAHAHGTQVTSTLMGYAPGELVGPAYAASAILVRAEDTSLSSVIEEDWWVAGLEWAELAGADLVSSSLGYWTFHSFSELDGDTAASSVAADMATARGLLVVNGAGNQGGTGFDVVVAPADADSVIAVGATTETGTIAGFSSSGPTYDGRIKPDVVAQGLQVAVADPYDDFAYTTAGGTSLSGPFVAGVAALILERAPFLTPMQVREALRETASQPDNPDNDYGWGLIDALAALHYWGPQFTHLPLVDTEDTTGPYVVAATVSSVFGLAPAGPWLRYRVNGGAWQETQMTAQGGGNYAADVPGLPAVSVVDYYLEASDLSGLSAKLPLSAPSEFYSFTVWQDLLAPVAQHQALSDQSLSAWPPYVLAQVTDNLGVAAVTLSFAINEGGVQGPHGLIHGLGDLYGRDFPLQASELGAGDRVSYTIMATDASLAGNTTVLGPFSFEILAGGQPVLILDDDAGNNEATTVAGWLGGAGYSTTVKSGNTAVAGDLDGQQAVVLLCGNNSFPLLSPSLRQLIENWVAAGGRLLVEGGELGYTALTDPSFASFASNVLHATNWMGDTAGSLVAATGQANHPLLTQPLSVAPPVVINFDEESDKDAMAPAGDALLVLQNANQGGTAGAIVFDDDAFDPAAQIVYYPIALAAVSNSAKAQALVVNALQLLLDAGPPTSVEAGPGSGDGVSTPVARLIALVPSPFHDRTVIRLELGQLGPARLAIFDVRGRLVQSLLDGTQPLTAGVHELIWNGRDAQGREVGSGTYYLRLEAGGVVERAKIALIR